MPNPSQEPSESSKAPNEDLKDLDVLCSLKTKIDSQILQYVWTKDQWPYPNQYHDSKPSQEPQESSKALNQDLKDMDVSCTFKINIDSLEFIKK